MAVREIGLRLSEEQRENLEAAWEAAKVVEKKPNLTLEQYVYKIFRTAQASWTNTRHRLEKVGYLVQPLAPKPGQSVEAAEKHRLLPGDVAWESMRCPEPAEGKDVLVIRFPSKLLDNMERGLALQNAWNSGFSGTNPATPVYTEFLEWAVRHLMEVVAGACASIEQKAIEKEEAELYPDLNTPFPTE